MYISIDDPHGEGEGEGVEGIVHSKHVGGKSKDDHIARRCLAVPPSKHMMPPRGRPMP